MLAIGSAWATTMAVGVVRVVRWAVGPDGKMVSQLSHISALGMRGER